MHVLRTRSTYRQVLWQSAGWAQSCIDVWEQQLRQQAGGTDGLWWPQSRLNGLMGQTQTFISSLLPRANNPSLIAVKEERAGGSLCPCSLRQGGLTRHQHGSNNGSSAQIHCRNQWWANTRASSRGKGEVFDGTDDMLKRNQPIERIKEETAGESLRCLNRAVNAPHGA